MKYHYTYFIYPFIIENYDAYILSLAKNAKCTKDNFQREKDLGVYNFFTEEAKKAIFGSFEASENDILSMETVRFRYKLEEDIQGKIGNEDGIFFKIQTIHILCFKCGIGFLIFKTNVENTENFSDLLDFNYKFRDINSDYSILKEYENIKIQTDAFENMENLKTFINEITNSTQKIDTNRFYTYSYVCLDEKEWENENINNEIKKFVNILPSISNANNTLDVNNILEKTKYSKFGITKYGVSLICSSQDSKNYLELPVKFENEYLYLYIISIYAKIYLKSIVSSIKEKKKGTIEEYLNLKNVIMINNITTNEFGDKLYKKYILSQNIEEISKEIENLIDVEAKKLDIEKTKKENKIILGILAISLIINIINFIALIFR